jgi:hypothetical protein
MVAHRTPTETLEAKGAFLINPSRRRVKHAESYEFNRVPPRHLDNPLTLAVWIEIVESAPDVLKAADQIHVEVLAELVAEFREAPREFPVAKLARMEQLLHKLGMNPAGRLALAELAGTKKQQAEKAPIDEFLH